MALVANTQKGERWEGIEIGILHVDGSIRTVLWNSATIFAPDGQSPIATIAQGLDVTERVRAREAMERQAQRLHNLHAIDQAILQAIESPRAIVQMAIQHLRELLECDRASVGIFDFESNEVMVFAADVGSKTVVRVGKTLGKEAFGDSSILQRGQMEIVEDMSLVASRTAIVTTLLAEGIHSYINVPLLSAHGLYGALNIGWNAPRTFLPEEMEIVGGVAAEVTIAIEQDRLRKDSRRHAAELEHRVKLLEASNRELDAFAYSLSHDLRAPLRTIDGFSLALLEDYTQALDGVGQDYLQRVRTAAQRMAQLIDDMLALSRVSRSELRCESVDLGAMAREIAESLRATDPGRDVDVVIAEALTMNGDARLLHVVLENLLGNAFKFTSRHATARIECGMADRAGERVFFVRDDGAGFDMKYSDKMFNAFQRMHSSSDFPGTGIGLATVQRIITRHGGQLWGEGEVEKGATFYFTLPGQAGPLPGRHPSSTGHGESA